MPRVAAEDVGEPGRDDGLEAVVLQRPDRVLARGAGAEVGAGDQDRGALARSGWLRTNSGSLRQAANSAVLEAGAGDPLEVDRGDDLVGVDVAAAQRDGPTPVCVVNFSMA